MAEAQATCQIVRLRALLEELKIKQTRQMQLKVDNKSAISLTRKSHCKWEKQTQTEWEVRIEVLQDINASCIHLYQTIIKDIPFQGANENVRSCAFGILELNGSVVNTIQLFDHVM